MRLLSACLRRIGALVVQGWRGEQVATLARVVVLVASATLTITAVGPAEPQGSAWDAEDFPNVLLVKQDRHMIHSYDLIKDAQIIATFVATSCNDVCPLETARKSHCVVIGNEATCRWVRLTSFDDR